VPPLRIEWTRARAATLGIFALTVAGWVSSAALARALGLGGEVDTLAALAAIALLCGSGTLAWSEIERGTRWSVLLLFGGGLRLSQVMGSSGASRFLAGQVITLLHGARPAVLLPAVVSFVVLLAELVSNTASAALLVPIFLGVANALGLPPVGIAAAIAVAASCAFMLPVATPPNAIVFATDQVPQALMMRCGLALNAVCAVAITVMVHLLHWQ